MAVLFWSSLFIILYAYFGYPLCLYIISFTKPNRKIETITSRYPNVSLLISAYNEENVIEDKILNSLSLNYPKDLLEIVVVSDASEDRTDEIVRCYIQKGVLLRSYEGRIGKTACLNKAVPLSKGDIIVFSDANSKYDRDAIKHLVKRFNDPKVGLVTGSTKYNSKNPNSISKSVSAYSKIEEITKKLESKIGSCVGADGAIFAIRKQLYQQLKEYDINDFVIPLYIIRQGDRAVLEEDAFCVEELAKGIKGEFKRQARITNRTLRAIFSNIDMLNPFNFGIFSFELLSHKLLKFLIPYFMLMLLITNVFLLTNSSLYSIFLACQLLFYLFGLTGFRDESARQRARLISVPQTFLATNMAILWGWVTYFKGETYTTWSSLR